MNEINWVESDYRHLLQNYGARDLLLIKGKGSYVWDQFGKKYLDFTSGIAVNALGHCFPAIEKAIKKQLKLFVHTSNLYLNLPSQKLAHFLVKHTALDKVFFCNSGTEANEAAIKFVRGFFGDSSLQIISFEQSFHGRTYGALSATGQESLKQKYVPMLEGFVTLPLNDVSKLKKACAKQPSAILVEPLLAEGGICSLTLEFIEAIKQCQEQGTLLICDEVQTGVGRLGEFLGSSVIGLKPDIVTLAKAIGGGLPLGAVLVNDKIAKTVRPGDHGSTFGGNPLACEAALVVVQTVKKLEFQIKEKALYFKLQLEQWLKESFGLDFLPNVKGNGLLLGIENKNPVDEILALFKRENLLVLKAGPKVIRFLPPLNVTNEQIDECIQKMTKALSRDFIDLD